MNAAVTKDFLPFLAASELAVHPALELIAAIDGDAFAAFLHDVREHGIREPIIIDAKNQIVDGRARRDAAVQLELDVPYVLVEDNVDVVAFVESKNVQRRHLSPVERAFIAAADLSQEHVAAKGRQGRDRGGESKTARQAAAEKRGVSAGYVGYADRIVRCGDPVLKAAVLARHKPMPLSTGARLAKMEPDKRQSLIAGAAEPNVRLSPRIIPDTICAAQGIERFDLDVATTIGNPVGARAYYSDQRDQDGVAEETSWRIVRTDDGETLKVRFVWCNPPYDDPETWVRKAIKTVEEHPEVAIWMLLQSRVIGTTAGRLANHAACESLQFDERLRFLVADETPMPGSLNDGSLLFAFGSANCRGLDALGTRWVKPHTVIKPFIAPECKVAA